MSEEMWDLIFETDDEDSINDKVEKTFLRENRIFYDTDVSQTSIGNLCKKILAISKRNYKDIYLHINSDGGDVYEFLRLYDTIHSIPNKVHIIGEGRLFSAGALIVACCATGKRYCHKHSSFMLHEISSGAIGKLHEMRNNIDEANRLQTILISLLKKKTKLKNIDYERLTHKDYYFDTKTAKKLGIVDKVL